MALFSSLELDIVHICQDRIYAYISLPCCESWSEYRSLYNWNFQLGILPSFYIYSVDSFWSRVGSLARSTVQSVLHYCKKCAVGEKYTPTHDAWFTLVRSFGGGWLHRIVTMYKDWLGCPSGCKMWCDGDASPTPYYSIRVTATASRQLKSQITAFFALGLSANPLDTTFIVLPPSLFLRRCFPSYTVHERRHAYQERYPR